LLSDCVSMNELAGDLNVISHAELLPTKNQLAGCYRIYVFNI